MTEKIQSFPDKKSKLEIHMDKLEKRNNKIRERKEREKKEKNKLKN